MSSAVTTTKLQDMMIDSEIKSSESFLHLPTTSNNDMEQGRLGIYPPVASNRTFKTAGLDEVLDLICIGFGPASIAIAIALQEECSATINFNPKVSFLERQAKFAWHSGMQLPGAKMQISFLKDLATPRNPRSHFSFLNYLYQQNRLNNYINLGTFSPTRYEYEDYLRWCASHFDQSGAVSYGQEVIEVVPDVVAPNGKVTQFRVKSRDIRTNEITTRLARHVVISVGGKAAVPKELPGNHPRVIHSSQYSMNVNEVLADKSKPYHIAVVGSGQSAAEIYNDLPSRYPNAKVTLIIRGSALRPSDDSPFVNEVFDPDRVDGIYRQGADARNKAIGMDRATNYGVVRLELLERLYEKLYVQKLKNPNAAEWKLQIKNNRQVIKTRTVQENGEEKIILQLQKLRDDGSLGHEAEDMAVDAVFFATGYVRNAHEDILKSTRTLLPKIHQGEGARFPVRRDYKVDFDERKVAANAGVWLQGCNETTHGVSFPYKQSPLFDIKIFLLTTSSLAIPFFR